jgi:hypothetical protein
MLKDIPKLIAENIALAVVKELNKQHEEEWNVYIINTGDKLLEGVLIASTGYGLINNEERKTTTLRHFIETLDSKTSQKVEMIVEDVFGLNNEYWVSYFSEQNMYDRKFIFLPETIKEENFTTVPILNKKGVLIK